jgi:predicted Zn-dependent peptidase
VKLQFETLPNGLEVIIIPRPGTRTVASRFFVRAGSRYDGKHPGLAHLLEHMLFQGSTDRSAEEIFAAIEARGGEINAHTSREYISLHTVTLAEHLPLALSCLANVAIQPALNPETFRKEKLVVFQEMGASRERSGALYDHFIQHLWQENPLRNPVIGTPEGVRDTSIEEVKRFHQRRFVGGNAVLVICGDIAPQEALSLAREAFAELASGPEQLPPPVDEPAIQQPRGGHLDRNSKRTYLLLGVPTVGIKHPHRSALKMIELVLGMGASGRLYRRLRQELGLVYNINAVSSVYEDAGFLAIHAACDAEEQTRVQDEILDSWLDLRQRGITAEELEAAKGNYAGTLARRFETNLSVAGIVGIEALLHAVESFEAAIGRINAVTCEGVRQAAQQYLVENGYVLVTAGKLDGS